MKGALGAGWASWGGCGLGKIMLELHRTSGLWMSMMGALI